MYEITEQDLFNALAPYHPTPALLYLQQVRQAQETELNDARKAIKALNNKKASLLSQITQLTNKKVAISAEVAKEQTRKVEVINSNTIGLRLLKFKTTHNLTYKRIGEMLGLSLSVIYNVSNLQAKSRHNNKIDKFLAKHGF